jgi:hypothetical protein
MRRPLTVPPIGEDADQAVLEGILVSPGNSLERRQPFAILGLQKISVELLSPYSCSVVSVVSTVGMPVKRGHLILMVDVETDQVGSLEDDAYLSSVLTGLHYLCSQEADVLCQSHVSLELSFEELRPFIAEVIDIASELYEQALEEIDEQDDFFLELRDSVCFASALVKRLVAFRLLSAHPDLVRQHQEIVGQIKDLRSESIRQLRRALREVKRLTLALGIEDQPRLETRRQVPYDPRKAYVFISYSHHDLIQAKLFAKKLFQAGVAHFVDFADIPYGAHLPEVIHAALHRATHMVVLISPGTKGSQWVNYEIGFADARKIVVIAYLQHTAMEVPGFLHTRRFLNPGQPKEEAALIDYFSAYRV